MLRDLRKYLYDIDQACQLLIEFTSDKTVQGYRSDAMLRSAVERRLKSLARL